jgi:2-methylisocitrate lyase-like PEP mutase family enzyme
MRTGYPIPRVQVMIRSTDFRARGGTMTASTRRPAVPDVAELERRCERLRSLQVPGEPLLLPNAWDAATARAVAAAGFPAIATTSGGVAATLGYEDHEGAPSTEMLAAANRITRAVDLPVTVDAEAGYGMDPTDLVAALREAGASGCNLEDTDHGAGELRDPAQHAEWLRSVREAASSMNYGLVINARIDTYLGPLLSGTDVSQVELTEDALARAKSYIEAGADSVFPIALCEPDALRRFLGEAPAPVNILRTPRVPPLTELADLGVARISWGGLLHRAAMEQFEEVLRGVAAEARPT